MKKGILVWVGALFVLPAVLGCEHVGRAWDHAKWHVHGAYQDLVEIHKEFDRHVFNLDETNPDRY